MQYLCEHGADVRGNHFALNWACQNSHVDVVKYLCEHGADVRENHNALNWAAGNGRPDVVETLLRHGAEYQSPITPIVCIARMSLSTA